MKQLRKGTLPAGGSHEGFNMMALVAHIATIDQAFSTLLKNQLRTIRRSGYSVVGISSAGPYLDSLKEDEIHHIALPIRRTIAPWHDLVSLVRLYRVLRREKPVVVHTHNPKPGLLGQLAAKLAGVPVVVNTVHGFYLYENMPRYLRQLIVGLERLAGRCSDAILFQSREDIEIALRYRICRSDQVRYLGNGIDLQQFDPTRLDRAAVETRRRELGIPDDSPVVGFVGRLAMERKGLRYFLEAGRALVDRNPKIRLLIVGGHDEGKPDSASPAVAKQYGLEGHAIFAGHLPSAELPPLYALMSAVVLPSLFEGLPRVLMEAAAMGVPAVASNVKGNREAIVDGVTGFLVPFGDSGSIVRQVERILIDKDGAQKMSHAARKLAAREFDERRVFDRILSEYQAILRHKRRPQATQSLAGSSVPNRLSGVAETDG
jgi:glycosyltransferase involved in cell wall biosynthesis